MATKRGGGPGTYSKNSVNSTMSPPFGKASSSRTGVQPGIDGRNKPPFDAPQSMSAGTIPTRFFDTSMASRTAKTVTVGQAAPSLGTRNVSKRRFSK